MLRLRTRLRKLEAQLIDGSGLRPRSREWMDYWRGRVTRVLNGEGKGTPGCIPLEVWDAIGDADGVQASEELAVVGAGAECADS